MFEIIPNWHPLFVHFSIALLFTASMLQVLVQFLGDRPLAQSWRPVVKWNLWLGAGFVVATVASGIVAFNSVEHDTLSHLAMLEHRSWALLTAPLFIVIAVWVALRHRQNKPLHAPVTVAMVIAALLLLSTAWHGGELVYRHGLGVLSLPELSNHDHGIDAEHSHDDHSSAEGGALSTPASSGMTQGLTDQSPHDNEHAHDNIESEGESTPESATTPSADTSSSTVHIHADGKTHEH